MIKNIKYYILACLIIFCIISITTIYSISLTNNISDIVTKQTIWYLIGFFLILFSAKIKLDKIIKYSNILYIIFNVLLFLLLIFGTSINGSKCWFVIPKLGSFQPSEFMKIILILYNAKILSNYDEKENNKTFSSDLKVFFIIMFITIVPSILTFLEPDTGMVIIYFIISFSMLFIYGIRKSIFILILILFTALVTGFLYYYFNYQDNFINTFGTSFFYRIDRLLDWQNKSGMQLTNALASIKAANIWGFGLGKTPIYIPEAHTDFIFSVYASNFGLIGTITLILTTLIFDISLLIYSNRLKNKTYKYIIIGFVTMILYQQIQNIGMNIGLLPITGITLPFISYGGSSLLSYIFGICFIINSKEKEEFIQISFLL